MNIRQYLSKKYKTDNPSSLLRCEAKVFGIKYPPAPGWLGKHGHTEITKSIRHALAIALRAHGGESAEAGLRVIGSDAAGMAQAKLNKDATKILSKKLAFQSVTCDQMPKIGGVPVDSVEFLSTYEWRSLRMEALKKYGPVCQCCGASPATGAVMNVDHIKPRRLFPHLALDINNLQVICHECNHGKGNWDMTDWRSHQR